MAALLYTAVVTPVDVCLIQDREIGLFVVNTFIDLLFLTDLILNFFLAFQTDDQHGGYWVTDRRAIRQRYLRGWFLIDFISIWPFELLDFLGLLSGQGTLIRSVRTLRVLRLVKLLRILRASRILARWRDSIGMSYAQSSVCWFLLLTSFCVHLMACIWGAEGLYWTPTAGYSLEFETSWIDAYNLTGLATHRLYSVSMYVAAVAMFGGVGSIAPQNYAEYVLLTSMMFIGSMVWCGLSNRSVGVISLLGGVRAGAGQCSTCGPQLYSQPLADHTCACAGVGLGDRLPLRHPCHPQPPRHGLPQHHGFTQLVHGAAPRSQRTPDPPTRVLSPRALVRARPLV